MKIWYEHLFGKLDKQDIQVVKVWADPQPQEYEDALAQGFVQLDEGWQQVRAVRINISKFIDKAKEPRTDPDITAEKITGTEAKALMDQLALVYDSYIKHHGFTMLDPNPLNEIDATDVVWLYRLHGDLIGFSIWSVYGKCLDNWQMAWNYADFKLQLGKYSLWHEVHQASNMKYNWFYLGASYDRSCKWKSSIPGFEWWTGSRWSDDKDAYNSAIQKDIDFKIVF